MLGVDEVSASAQETNVYGKGYMGICIVWYAHPTPDDANLCWVLPLESVMNNVSERASDPYPAYSKDSQEPLTPQPQLELQKV